MVPNQIGVSADRIVATVVNGIEVARYGGLKTEHNPSPYRVEAHEPMYRLRHYFPESRRQRPPGRPRRCPRSPMCGTFRLTLARSRCCMRKVLTSG